MLQVKRIPEWKNHLSRLINVRRNSPFKWGEHDCALWAALGILTITGTDIAENATGTYDTEIGAYKCLKKVYDVDNVKEVFSERFEECHVAWARPGDIVYKNSNLYGFNVALGICYGQSSFFIMPDEDGLVSMNTLMLDGCFRIG